MNILVFIPNLIKNSGGAEVYGLYLANALAASNDVKILTCEPEKSDSFEIIHIKYGIENIKTVFIRLFFLPQTSNKLLLLLNDFYWSLAVNHKLGKCKPDVFVNCHQNKVIIYKDVKSIYITHFPPELYHAKFLKFLNRKFVDSYDQFVSNSEFTKKHLNSMYKTESKVLYPPITFSTVDNSALNRKEKIILAVDRISSDKKILEMIEAFKKLLEYTNDYRFVIVGNKIDSEESYYNEIINSIKNYPIEMHNNVTYNELGEWYLKSTFFWHAKGYLIEDEKPSEMEHFGMTTVEAMMNGCIPIVINKAGQKEIMQNGLSELTWEKMNQLVDITYDLICNPPKILYYQNIVLEMSRKYDYSYFKKNALRIVEELK